MEKRMASMENTVGRKSNSNGNKKGKDKMQGKEGTSNSIAKCKICGKRHKGECWEKVESQIP